MSNENNQVIFKTKCQSEFDALLPQAYALIKDQTGEDCDKQIILRFADLGKVGGRYGPFYKKDGMWYPRESVTLNSQLIDHPKDTQAIIAHELAHFVIDRIKAHHGINDRRGKWGAHGSEWKKAAISLGNTGERCHRLPLNTSKFKVRMTAQEGDEVQHWWLMNTKGISKWHSHPDVIKIEVKDSEGFWNKFVDAVAESPCG